ncbi:MAG: ATP-binding protein, partial [Cyclobacteriaceae bacterium]
CKTLNAALTWVGEINEAEQKISPGCDFDIALIDYRLGSHSGIELLRKITDQSINLPVIMLTGQGDLSVDLNAMKEGAFDFMTKDRLDAESLERTLRYAIRHSQTITKLYASEQRYKSLFERSLDGVFILDHTMKVIDISPSFLTLFKGENERYLDDNLEKIFLNITDYQFFRDQILSGRSNFRNEFILADAEMNPIISEVSATVRFSADKEIIGIQGLVRDLTRQKKMESEMIHSERLAVTGRIARNIAHEVRNPLTNLKLALSQLSNEIEISGDHMSLLSIIDRNSNRIEALINDLLESSKPQKLNIRQYSVCDIVRESTQLVADRITLKNMKLNLDFSFEGQIWIDPDRLKTALLNLYLNAVEAMTEKAGVLSVSTSQLNNMVKINIEDNGCGISTEEQRKLFDPFFSNKGNGMGLGLTSAQNIIKSHCGLIEVDSTPGKGTIFSILLPQNRAVTV